MPHSLLPTLLLQMLIVGYTPGPANLYSLAMSLRHDRHTSFRMWTGLLAGFSLSVSIMAILTHIVGLALGEYVAYLKYMGAAYMLWLAWRIWNRSQQAENDSRECTFLSGMLVQLTNAKMLLFDMTVFSTFVLPYSNRLSDLLQVSAWLLIAGPGGNLAWLLAGSYLRKFFIHYGRQVDIISAIALALCAIYIIWPMPSM